MQAITYTLRRTSYQMRMRLAALSTMFVCLKVSIIAIHIAYTATLSAFFSPVVTLDGSLQQYCQHYVAFLVRGRGVPSQ